MCSFYLINNTKIKNMNKDNKNTEVVNTDKKLHISDVNDLFNHSDMVLFASYCTEKDTKEIDEKFYEWLNRR